MSRLYDCNIFIEEKLSPETYCIIDLCTGNVYLHGGESEEDYANRVMRKIWESENRSVDAEIVMTYLEDMPYESYVFNEEQYKKYIDNNSANK